MKKLLLVAATALLTACQPSVSEVNLYSARKETLMRPLLDAFTAETGIKVNVISSKADALLKRIESEGRNSPADVLLTTDAGRLYRAKSADILAPIESTALIEGVPISYRDSGNTWFGLSLRVRPIMLSTSADELNIESYEALADPIYRGQICIRSSSNIYNQSLVAAMMEAVGEQAAETWAKGLVANMARNPQGGDSDQIRASGAGQCSIVIANTYYLARMLADADNTSDYEAAGKLRVVWPNQAGRGAHVNVSGAGVLKTAPNRDNAIKLIEFLASEKAQQIYADVNFEYPVRAGIEVNDVLQQWGEFKADTLALEKLGENNAAAVKLMDRAGWK